MKPAVAILVPSLARAFWSEVTTAAFQDSAFCRPAAQSLASTIVQELLGQVLTVVAPQAVVIPSEMDGFNGELSRTGTCGSVPQYSSLKLNESVQWFPPLVRFYCIVRCSKYINYNPILARSYIIVHMYIFTHTLHIHICYL